MILVLQVSGQKFYYLRNAGALLELALVNWAMSRVVGATASLRCSALSAVLDAAGGSTDLVPGSRAVG